MMSFDNFYNMKIAIVDLSELSSEIIPLDDHLVAEKIGGVAVNVELFKRYGNDNVLVLGVGPLTGSFAPASGLSVATFSSPRFGHLCHVPLMVRTGPEMKFSSIDFLVIKGTASSPTILHLDKKKIRFLSAGHLTGHTVPETFQLLKKQISQSRSIVLVPPAADHGVLSASVSIDLNGSLDKAGLASLMASKNLKGIIFNGMYGLPFGEDNLVHKQTIERTHFANASHKKEGFLSILDKIGIGKNLRGIIKKSKWHTMACYHCPNPCMSSVKFTWHDPREKDVRTQSNILLSDHMGFLALAEKKGKDVFPLLESCLRYGLDPVAVAERLSGNESLLEALLAIEEMSVTPERPGIGSESRTREDVTGKMNNLFGGGLPPIMPGESWGTRVYLSMILGACPIFLLRFPQISEMDLLGFLTKDEFDLEELEENLNLSFGNMESINRTGLLNESPPA